MKKVDGCNNFVDNWYCFTNLNLKREREREFVNVLI